jgi:hypothetical protein
VDHTLAKIRNRKHETQNKHEIQNPNDRNDGGQDALAMQAICRFSVSVIWVFGILICFGFRISNFGFGPERVAELRRAA